VVKVPVSHEYVGQAGVLHNCWDTGLAPAPEQNESTTVAPASLLHSTVLLCVPPPQVTGHVVKVPVNHEYVGQA